MKLQVYLFAMALTGMSSCSVRDDFYNLDSDYRPELLTRPELEKAIKFVPPREFVNVIATAENSNYRFLVDLYQRIHVVDLNKAGSPEIKFMIVPGCTKISRSGNSITFNSGVDLVTADISTMDTLSITNRQRNALNELLPPDLHVIPDYASMNSPKSKRPANTIIVGWTLRK